MKPFTPEQHQDALIRRRIKFVAEKGAMARLFKAGVNSELQEEVFARINIKELSIIQSQQEYDAWLMTTVELDCWSKYSRNGIANDRWAYFAKLLNIIIYEIISNRELVTEDNWLRLRPLLHVPIDWNVTYHLNQIDHSIPAIAVLKGMTKERYLSVQSAIRSLANRLNLPPIWFEAAYSS